MFSPLATELTVTSDFSTLAEAAAEVVFVLVPEVLVIIVFLVPTPVVLVVVVEDLVTDVALALAVVVVVEVPFTLGAVFVSVDCPVLLGRALAVPGEAFWVDFAVVERIRFVVFLVSFSGTGFAELDNGFRVTVEVGAGRGVGRGAGFAVVPFTLVLSAFSTFLAGALTGLFAAVVVVVAVVLAVAVAGLVVVGLLVAVLGLVRGALGAICVAGFGTFFSVGLGAAVAGFVVVVFGRGFAAGLAAAGCLVGVVFDAVGLVVGVVFSAAGLVVDEGFDTDLSGVGFFSAGFVAVLADGVVFAGIALPGVDRADVGFPGLSAAAFVDFAGDLTTSGSGVFTSSCGTTGMTTVPLLIRISSLFSATGASTSGSGSLVTTGAGSGSTTLGSGTRIGEGVKTSATGGTGEDSTAGETETGSGSIMGETGAGEGSG